MVRLCFVCLGNICRSPTAEAVMKKLVHEEGLEGEIEVDSAGTGDYHVGEAPDSRSTAAARARGVVLGGRAAQFTRRDFARCDLVLAMDRKNAQSLRALARDDAERAKIHLFRDFDPASEEGSDVPDPYYGGEDGFGTVLDICEAACRGLLDHLRSEGRVGGA
jgi:protein-tyrosine phosphatase